MLRQITVAHQWTRVNDNEQTFTISGLEEDTLYNFVISAYNTAGAGPTSLPVSARTLPGCKYEKNFLQYCYLSIILE